MDSVAILSEFVILGCGDETAKSNISAVRGEIGLLNPRNRS